MPRTSITGRSIPGPTLGDLLTARPTGLDEPESWAILCQAVQALQDLFLSDGASSKTCIPLVTPSTLMLSSRGRVKLCHSQNIFGDGPPTHLTGYLAPEYRPNKQCSDTEMEKMWIYGLGETLKRATLTSHVATSRLSSELCRVLADMTRLQASSRSSLMHLLDVISQYCRRKQQNRPFSHIVMDLHQEAMAALEVAMDTPWGPPAMPELRPRTKNRSDSSNDSFGTIPRRWMGLARNKDFSHSPKMMKEASTSMEDLHLDGRISKMPGTVTRPKSLCVPESRNYNNNGLSTIDSMDNNNIGARLSFSNASCSVGDITGAGCNSDARLFRVPRICDEPGNNVNNRRLRARRNPVQRAASRLYRAGSSDDRGGTSTERNTDARECIGPEFVVRASLPSKLVSMSDSKGGGGGGGRKTITVIMLNGQKLDVICNPNSTTAGQLFETIIQKEHIEENFMLGLSALIAGDFVFLPSDTRICKAFQQGNIHGVNPTLFMRIRFFLPNLRGIRGPQARHLLYLQIRRSILEHQLPCSFRQIIELNGLALQAEFGDFKEKEHGTRDYFLLEHYIPETMSCMIEDSYRLKRELMKAHISKKGLLIEKAENDFISFAQTLPHYGGHFYTASWMLKDNNYKDVWLYISAQGINLYERGQTTSNCGPQLYENFEWRAIQTLCYSKHYLCILPHNTFKQTSKLKKYKLKMDHKKSYFTFRLASLHHQFFLRLRTEYTSLQSLSQQFGIPLKDIKNEKNSICKLETLSNPNYSPKDGTVNAETEFKIDFRVSSRTSLKPSDDNNYLRRSKSATDFNDLEEIVNEDHQNRENENPNMKSHAGLILESKYLSGLSTTNITEKRRGVKMGTRAFVNAGQRVSRSMEAMNATTNEYLEDVSLQSIDFHCSSTSLSKSSTIELKPDEAYILDSTIKPASQQLLPNFQETLSESLLEKLNNLSFADERVLTTVSIKRDRKRSLGIQITEGSDGNVYIQSVIPGGPAHLSGKIQRGDQVVAVDGESLLGMKYEQALNLLKSENEKVEFILARAAHKTSHSFIRNKTNLLNAKESRNHMQLSHRNAELIPEQLCPSPVEKYLTESCHDSSNRSKYSSYREVPYHKHIRYEIEPERENVMFKKPLTPSSNATLSKTLSKSCSHLYSQNNDKAVVVEMIPKNDVDIMSHFHSLDRKLSEKNKDENNCSFGTTTTTGSGIALPRSLGLGRKWRGPVRYPVTPVKKSIDSTDVESGFSYVSTSDEEQVFI